MADESAILAKWVFDTLSADATITAAVSTRIYPMVKQGVTYPYIVYTITPLSDENTLGALVWANLLLSVKVIDQRESYKEQTTIVSAIFTLLNRKSEVAVTGGTIKNCLRERGIRYSEDDAGRRYTHQGHLFVANVKAS